MDQVWEDWTIKIWNSLDLKNAEMHCGNVQFFFFSISYVVWLNGMLSMVYL